MCVCACERMRERKEERKLRWHDRESEPKDCDREYEPAVWVCVCVRERDRERERELFEIRRKLSQSLFSQRNRLRSDQRFYFPGFSFDLIPMSGLRRVNMKYDFPDGNKPFLFKL